MSHRATDALPFTIEPRALVYARRSRKVVRFDPPRLVAECPMPDCEWSVTAPDSPAGSALACIGRARHATGDHPAAIEAGMLVLAPAPYDADESVDRVLIVRHDVTAAECGPTCRPVDPASLVEAPDHFSAPMPRMMGATRLPAPRASGYSSGQDLSRPGDHGIVRRLP